MRKMNSSLLGTILVVLTSLVASSALAQQAGQPQGAGNTTTDKQQALDINVVTPAVRPGDGFSITRPNDLGHLGFSANLMMNYTWRSNSSPTATGKPFYLLEHHLMGNLGLSLGLFERVSVDVLVPLQLVLTHQEGNAPPGAEVAQGPVYLGDVQAGVRGRLYGGNDDVVSLGLYAGVIAPTAQIFADKVLGKKQYYQGTSGGVGARAAFLAEYRPLDRLALDLNLGVAFVGGGSNYPAGVDCGGKGVKCQFNNPVKLQLALGGSYALLPEKNLTVHAELNAEWLGFSQTGMSAKERPSYNLTGSQINLPPIFQWMPAEALAGVKYSTDFGLTAGLAVGAGFSVGLGTPQVRGLFTLGWSSGTDPDTDGDGLHDSMDKCPNDPEDFDGYQDQDGCPEADNDGDGILDGDDQCPNEAEDIDGFEDSDGCPDPDNDKDNIADVDDKCPDEAGIPEKQGCPFRDADGDGIEDEKDKCPSEPEDKDGFQDDDGCPEADNDGDGILDGEDACPNEAGPISNKGCPVKDRDGDGIPDDVDKCPDKPETYNGNKDEDGCPDGKATVVVTQKEIRINETIYFKSGKSDIQRRSFKLLDTVAGVLKRYDQITKLLIAGYTDDVGDDASNLQLSKDRAKAVLDYLVSKGVAADRLSSEGYGEEDPVCTEIPELTKTKRDARKNRRKIKECRAENRRVVFRVIELNHKPVDAAQAVTVTEKVEEKEAPAPAAAPKAAPAAATPAPAPAAQAADAVPSLEVPAKK